MCPTLGALSVCSPLEGHDVHEVDKRPAAEYNTPLSIKTIHPARDQAKCPSHGEVTLRDKMMEPGTVWLHYMLYEGNKIFVD